MKSVHDASRRLILVKHALPVLDASKPPREWRLGPEGAARAKVLAGWLRASLPFRLVSSTEPKATRTSEIIADELGLAMTSNDDLREIDRRALPIMSTTDHARLNQRLFERRDERVLGAESAREAVHRFTTGVLGEVRRAGAENLVLVTHGTVLALFVAEHNPVDAFELWQRVQCSGHVVLDSGTLALIEVVPEV